jgi:prolyl oligopeptidase
MGDRHVLLRAPPVAGLAVAAVLAAFGGCASRGQPVEAARAADAAAGGGAPAGVATAPAAAATRTTPAYPRVPRGDTVDLYHGTSVADPYRWLESLESAPTRAFVATQNALSRPALEALPQRPWIQSRLAALWSYERYGAPVKAGGRYFYLRNDGRQNQSVLHVAESLDAPGRVLFDPNAERADATLALTRFEPSPDGRLVAYAVADGGTDWEVWRFLRVDDGRRLPDELRRTKFWQLSWARDASGVWYSRYAGRSGAAGDPRGDDQSQPLVMFHRLGQPQARDAVAYRVTDHPTRAPSAEVTDDGRWLVVTLFDGYQRNGVDVVDLRAAAAKPLRLFGGWDALYTFFGSEGDTLYFRTTNGAPRGRVIAVDARRGSPADWREVVPESADNMTDAAWVGDRIVASYVRDARGVARLFATDGRALGDVPLPGLGTIGGFPRNSRDAETFFGYTDYLRPAQVMRYDAATNAATLFRAPRLAASTDAYLTRQVFVTSRDGTQVPMFLTHRRDLAQDGNAPTLLSGYGGFNIPTTPAFRPQTLLWLEMGGIYAEAVLRGGGDYGAAWHEAGTLTRKQNVFDDFIAAAEYVVREGYTNPRRLAISGASNGGLLVGATLLQRPDLFAAALPHVGVLDMLRYQTASANARQWASDYGLSEDPLQFAALAAYSPVHNVRPGACYPATLVTTSDHDDRVLPWHSYKFAAALQHGQGCPNPVYLRVETRAGHGASEPVWMRIENAADQLAFVADAIGLRVSR